MSTSILEALEYMRELIRAGWEFPDAAYRAARVFHVKQGALEQVPLNLRSELSYKKASQFAKAAQNSLFLKNERGVRAMLERADPYVRHIQDLLKCRQEKQLD